MRIYTSIFWLVLRCLLVPKKENLSGFSTGLTGRSKNLDPTGNPTGAGQPDRFPFLVPPRRVWNLKQCENIFFIDHIVTDNNKKNILSKLKPLNNQLLGSKFGEFPNYGP